MPRRSAALVIATIALASLAAFAAACGDGSGDGGDETQTAAAPATRTPEGTPVLPTPIPRDDDTPVVHVVFGQAIADPTATEFRALPTVESAGVEGVSLAEIGRLVGVDGDAVVTVEGRSRDLTAGRFFRGTLSEVGDDLVLEIGDDGFVRLAGSFIEENAWLYAVESVGFE